MLDDDGFLRRVGEYIGEHLSDWSEDFAKPEEMKSAVARWWNTLDAMASIDGNTIAVWRAELRPITEIEDDSYPTIGCFWTWNANSAAICWHDNAAEEHGDAECAEVTFEATVNFRDVNWVATVAKNLVLRNEREIMVNDGTKIMVRGIYAPDWHSLNKTFTVSNAGHEF